MATFVYPPVTISTAGLATEATLSAINAKINDNYGASSGAVRTAAQVGNATGAADFGSGTTSAQTQRAVLATDQTPIPATQSGPWDIQSIVNPVDAAQFGTWNIATVTDIVGTISLPTGAATESTLSNIDSTTQNMDGNIQSIAGDTPVISSAVQSSNTHLSSLDARLDGGLVPFTFDYQAISYVGVTTDIDTIVYKSGGSGGTTVATLTMGYDGSNRLTSITRT